MRKKRIVVFEEFESITNVIAKALESKGYEVIKFNSINKFDEVFNGLSYSIIIADNDNSNGAAHKLIGKIRETSSYLFTPIILMITGDKDKHAEKFSEFNIACFLTKPFDMMHFHSVVSRLA